MPRIPDHPEVARALATGYPKLEKSVFCSECGKEFAGDHRMYILAGDIVCPNCLISYIREEVGLDGLADALDIERTTAYDFIVKMEEP